MDTDSDDSSVNSDIGGFENDVECDFDSNMKNSNNNSNNSSNVVGTVKAGNDNNIGISDVGNEFSTFPSRSFSKELRNSFGFSQNPRARTWQSMEDGATTARLWPQDLASEQTFTNPTHEPFGDDDKHVE